MDCGARGLSPADVCTEELGFFCQQGQQTVKPPDRFWSSSHFVFKEQKWNIFSGVKQPGRETEHSSPSSANVKNVWIYTSTPYAFVP